MTKKNSEIDLNNNLVSVLSYFIILVYMFYYYFNHGYHTMYVIVTCGSRAFSLEEGRIAPLPLPRHVVRGDYLECLAM